MREYAPGSARTRRAAARSPPGGSPPVPTPGGAAPAPPPGAPPGLPPARGAPPLPSLRLPAFCSPRARSSPPPSAVFPRRVRCSAWCSPRAGCCALGPSCARVLCFCALVSCPPVALRCAVFAVLFGFVACFLFGFVLCLCCWFAGAGVRARCRFWRCPVALRSFARSSVRSVRFPLARRLALPVSRFLSVAVFLPRWSRPARVLRFLASRRPSSGRRLPLFALPAPAAFPPALACAALLPAGVVGVGCGAAPRSPSGASFFWVFPVFVSVGPFAASLSRSLGARVSVRCVAGAAWRVSVPCLPCLPARCSVGGR